MSQIITLANANDLVKGQGEYSSIREILKQYVPLNGKANTAEVDISHPVPVENHTSAAAPPEKETTEPDFLFVRKAHEKATGNHWNQSGSEAYEQNNIGTVPVTKIISVMETVAQRTPTKINSFKYFVKEITAQPDPRNRAWQKKRLEKVVHNIRDISVGRGRYSMADFVEDVKCSCAREGIAFDNDGFNELVC